MYSWIWRIRNVYTGQLLTSEFDLSETTLAQNIAFTKDEMPKKIFREMKNVLKSRKLNEVTEIAWFMLNEKAESLFKKP